MAITFGGHDHGSGHRRDIITRCVVRGEDMVVMRSVGSGPPGSAGAIIGQSLPDPDGEARSLRCGSGPSGPEPSGR